jgi:carbon monoxide dehydrogenase subunit G
MWKRVIAIVLFTCLTIIAIVFASTLVTSPTMVGRENSIFIERPPATVFAFVSDARNDPQWHTDIPHAELRGDGPIGVGSVFDIEGLGDDSTYTVVEFDPPRKIVDIFRVYGINVTITIQVEPQGNGARVTRRIETPVRGLLVQLLEMGFAVSGARSMDFLVNLKQVLEGPETTGR